MKHRTGIFRMKLYTHIPTAGWHLYNLHQPIVGIDTATCHSCLFKILTKYIVEFIPVAMAFHNVLTPI